MKLQKVLEGLSYQFQGSLTEITGLSYDSRKVQQGHLFVAIRGMQRDGHDFVEQARQNGAVAVLLDRWIPGLDLTQVVVEDTRRALGIVGANFYDKPGNKMRLLGITGTNGKTTCTYLVKSILEKAGYRVGLIGTIQILIGDQVLSAHRTTPESLDLQHVLFQMVQEKVDFVVMEVSSHALELHRTIGLSFTGALFTNLSQDHLDFHKTIDQYFAAKTKLFKQLQGPAVLNLDDQWGKILQKYCTKPVLGYGVDEHTDFHALNIELENSGVSYILNSEIGQIPISLQLTGYFNVYNSLGAAALCWSQGVALQHVKAGLEAVSGVSGRFEKVENDRGLRVIVDYAHTPDGLDNILRTAQELVFEGRLILVFGAGGDRDKSKRPLMGAVAAQFADMIIITSDNPRTEDPQEICSSIEMGLLAKNPQILYEIIVNRRDAIKKAIELAEPADLVIIAGKGHETYQEFAKKRVHFDDGEEVRAAIKELKD